MANTVTLPLATQALPIARSDWNTTFESILTCFYGLYAPTISNFTIAGSTPVEVPRGTVYRSSNTGAVYISDPGNSQSNPVYGDNFTRNGIGAIVEPSIAALYSNVHLRENGELLAVTPGANARLYMKTSSVANTVIDVGAPYANSVSSAELQNNAVVQYKIATGAITTDSGIFLVDGKIGLSFASNSVAQTGSNLVAAINPVAAANVFEYRTTIARNWTGPQRANVLANVSGNLNMDSAQNFLLIPAGAATLEFNNEIAGQSGFITFRNTANYAISYGSEVLLPGGDLDLSNTGTYLLSYYCDGSNVFVSGTSFS